MLWVVQAEQEHAIAEERTHAAAAQAQLAAQLEDARAKLAEARAAEAQHADLAAELAAEKQRSMALIAQLQARGTRPHWVMITNRHASLCGYLHDR